MAKLFSLILLSLITTACGTRYNHTIPVEDITASTSTSEKIKQKPAETIDLNSVDINVNENKTPAKNEVIDLSSKESETSTTSENTPVVEPVEITSVESKPANQLLSQANEAASAGNYSKANAILDRALAISPRDPKLWHKKSQIMYKKGDYRQASSMAMRSNTMASNSGLKKQNWRIIADAREKMGDLSGAEQARKFARQ